MASLASLIFRRGVATSIKDFAHAGPSAVSGHEGKLLHFDSIFRWILT